MMLGLGLGLPIASGSFQPTQIGGCVLWLRADLGITLNGSTVSAWADQGGLGNNATQGTQVNQPAYNASDAGYGGHPTLAFASASSQYLQFASLFPAQPFTVYVVGESTSGAAAQAFFADQANDVSILWDNGFWTIYGGTTVISSTDATQASRQAFAGVFAGVSSALYINSSATAAASGNAGSANPGTKQLLGSANGAQFLNGKIAEVVVYSGAHTSAQVAQLFRYFAARYGGAWS